MQKFIEDYGSIILLAIIMIGLFAFFSNNFIPKLSQSSNISDTKKESINQNKLTIMKPQINGLTTTDESVVAAKVIKGGKFYPCNFTNVTITWNDKNQSIEKRRLVIKITKNGKEWKTLDSRDPESATVVNGDPIATLKNVAIITDEVGVDNSGNDGTHDKETTETDYDEGKPGSLSTSSVNDSTDTLDSYILEYIATNGKGYYYKQRIKLISY